MRTFPARLFDGCEDELVFRVASRLWPTLFTPWPSPHTLVMMTAATQSIRGRGFRGSVVALHESLHI